MSMKAVCPSYMAEVDWGWVYGFSEAASGFGDDGDSTTTEAR